MKQYQTQLIIAGTVVILVILILINRSLSQPRPSPSENPPIPTQRLPNQPFQSTENIPTLPSTRGKGVDIQSDIVQDSKTEIEKLKTALPYIKTITVNGEEITIRIPEIAYQDFSWNLIVYLPDFDFQAPTETPYYSSAKNTFREVAAEVYTWIESQGADPKKIIIRWGDTAFTQERATEWLK